MYLKSRVKIPDVHGKLTRLRRGDITYIKYEYDRYYDPEKKYTYPQRATIGKVCADDDTMMIPNEAFLKYFPDAVLSGMEDRTERSSCLRVGTYAAIHKIVSDYSLDKMLGQFFSERDMADVYKRQVIFFVHCKAIQLMVAFLFRNIQNQYSNTNIFKHSLYVHNMTD